MTTFGERLRAERKRLGLSQTDFASLAGMTKKTQMLYEANERVPDANYLMAIHKANANVHYILTDLTSTFAECSSIAGADPAISQTPASPT